MGLIGELVVKVTGNTTQFDQSINKSQITLDKFAKGAVSLGKSLTMALTLPILGLGTAFVKAASDAEETRAKFGTVFGEFAESTEKWAKDYSKSVGRSTTTNIQFLASVQDLFVPLGYTRGAAAELSKSVVQLATDVSSFNNLPTGDVMRDIQSALVGNHETVRKYGVILSEAAISQELLNMGVKDGYKAATDMEKVQARLNLIFRGTTDAQGDAVRTADSFANQMRALGAEVKDLAESFGKLLIPVLKEVIKHVKNVIGSINALDESTKKTILTIAAILAVVGPAIYIIGKLATAVNAITALFPGATAAITGFLTAIGATVSIIAGPLLAAMAILVAIPAAIYLIALATRDETAAKREAIKFQKEINEEYVTYAANVGKAAEEIRNLNKQEIFRDMTELMNIITRLERRLAGMDKMTKQAMDLQNTIFTYKKALMELKGRQIELIQEEVNAEAEARAVIGELTKKNDEEKIESYREATHEIQSMMTDHLEFASVAAAEERQIAIDKEKAIRDEAAKTAQLQNNLANDILDTTRAVVSAITQIWSASAEARIASEDLSAEEAKKLRRDAAIAAKAMSVFMITISTAEAIVRALASLPWPFSVAASVLAGIRGAAQLAAVIATPIPAMAKGGVVAGEQIVKAGEAGPELIMPLTDEVFARLAEAIEDARAPSIQNVLADERPINLSVMIPDLGKTLNAHITKASRLGHILIDNKRGITR